MSASFDAWSDEALRGYLVMLGDFLSGSMQEDPGRAGYVERLERARLELDRRARLASGTTSRVAFSAEGVVTGSLPS